MRRSAPWFAAILLVLVSILAGCSLLERDGTGSQSEPTQTSAAFATVTLTPEPTPTATPTPQPTAVPRSIRATGTTVDESGMITIDYASLPEDGWLVIYRQVDGQPGDVIGQTALAAGVHEDVDVTVDPSAATSTLYAGLHVDAGTKGVFEFPGDDEPWPGEPKTRLQAELLMPRPSIEVADQAVSDDGVVMLDRVEVQDPTWVLLFADAGGVAGQPVGRTLLEPGIHENVTMRIPWRQATPVLHAVLYEDQGEAGRLEDIVTDPPILIDGQPIMASFRATYPPNILVFDQPLIDSGIEVNRVISDGPGWIVVYYDEEGQPGLIIGSAPLNDGLNENVRVNVIESAVTPQLYVRLHEDSEPDDDFNFPAEDPVVLFDNRLPPAVPFRITNDAQIIVENQEIGDDDPVTVSLVVNPVDTWVAVQIDQEGQPGRMLGRTLVPAGVNTDVQIQLDPGWEPGVMHIVLYRDLGTPKRYDALGVDPLLANSDGKFVQLPFTLDSRADMP